MNAVSSFATLIHWYEQRLLRERVLLLICCAVILYFAWDILIMRPVDLRKRAVKGELSQLQADVAELNPQETVILARKDYDPDRENRQRLVVLQAESAKLQQQLQENITGLVSPQEMPGLLKNLLLRQQKLQLLSLENLPAEPLRISAQAAEGLASPGLYRHRLQLVFSGDYLTILAYLRKLETLPRQLIWETLEIETQEYPRAKVHLQIYTLSLEKGWIGG